MAAIVSLQGMRRVSTKARIHTHTDRVHKSETECNATPNWTLQGRRPLKVPEADKMMRVAVLIRKSSCSDSGHVHQ